MTTPDRFPSVYVPPSPPVRTPPERLALLCSLSAPRLALVPVASLFPASRFARAFLNPRARSPEVIFSLTPTIGSASQTG
jgi:hypothetical protein